MKVFLAMFFLIVLTFIGMWDVYCSYKRWPDETVSACIQDWSRSFTILPILIGIVIGHVFFPMPSRKVG